MGEVIYMIFFTLILERLHNVDKLGTYLLSNLKKTV